MAKASAAGRLARGLRRASLKLRPALQETSGAAAKVNATRAACAVLKELAAYVDTLQPDALAGNLGVKRLQLSTDAFIECERLLLLSTLQDEVVVCEVLDALKSPAVESDGAGVSLAEVERFLDDAQRVVCGSLKPGMPLGDLGESGAVQEHIRGVALGSLAMGADFVAGAYASSVPVINLLVSTVAGHSITQGWHLARRHLDMLIERERASRLRGELKERKRPPLRREPKSPK